MNEKPRILFLCTGNSCRSQMAEGFCRQLRSGDFECASAGIVAHGLNPNAVKVMAEVGVDISEQRSQTLGEFGDAEFDYGLSVCDNARESCPVFPARVQRLHHSFDDPPALAENAATGEEALDHYRRVRDEIRAYIEEL